MSRGPSDPELGLELDPAAAGPAEKPHYHDHRARLRARYLKDGGASLADYEILEIVLFGAIPRRDVKPLAKRMIAELGGLGAVLNADPVQLQRRFSVSETSAVQIAIVATAARAMLREEAREAPVISSWQALVDYLSVAMKYREREAFRILFLDRKNRLIADEEQQQGTVDQAPVYPREVARRALELSASAVILVHNHPSGDPKPSRADVAITRDVQAALQAIDVALHDHLIVARRGNASLKTLGLI